MTPERRAQLRLTATSASDSPCDGFCAQARRGDVRDLLAENDALLSEVALLRDEVARLASAARERREERADWNQKR